MENYGIAWETIVYVKTNSNRLEKIKFHWQLDGFHHISTDDFKEQKLAADCPQPMNTYPIKHVFIATALPRSVGVPQGSCLIPGRSE